MEIKIERVERHSKVELVTGLRRVTMLLDRDSRPYEQAGIDLVDRDPGRICPAQRYILRSELEKVQSLKWALEEHGINLFRLEGYVSIWLEGHDEGIDVLPPIVEVSREANGAQLELLNDGMHRVYLARWQWSEVQVVLISGIPPQFPYYAYPLPDKWAGVEVVSALEEGKLKKLHRIPNNKKLYRDFNSGFVNVGGPRKVS